MSVHLELIQHCSNTAILLDNQTQAPPAYNAPPPPLLPPVAVASTAPAPASPGPVPQAAASTPQAAASAPQAAAAPQAAGSPAYTPPASVTQYPWGPEDPLTTPSSVSTLADCDDNDDANIAPMINVLTVAELHHPVVDSLIRSLRRLPEDQPSETTSMLPDHAFDYILSHGYDHESMYLINVIWKTGRGKRHFAMELAKRGMPRREAEFLWEMFQIV